MEIEFDEETHTYLVDGIITPSVTQLIDKIFIPGKYAGVSKRVLKKAAEHGNRVHSLIEYWNEHSDTPEDYDSVSYEGIALRRYQTLQERNNIVITHQEVPVAYVVNGKALYAGKFDMLGTVNGIPALIDIKTTTKCDFKYLAYQLTLYAMAIEQTLGIKPELLFA